MHFNMKYFITTKTYITCYNADSGHLKVVSGENPPIKMKKG